MNERDRLIELIENGFFEALSKIKGEDKDKKACVFLADHLIGNGVIVPPVKVGDTFFYVYFSDDEKEYRIDELKVFDVSTRKVFINEFGDTIGIDEFGTTAFISYRAAKKAAERLNNEGS